MAIRINLYTSGSTLLNNPLKLPSYPNHFPTHFRQVPKSIPQRITRTRKRLNDAELASDLAAEVEKINTHLGQREEALKKSRELLFTELCQFLDLESEEVKKKWRKMGEEEKWVLVKGFVSEWEVSFQPLSVRSMKEMVEEFLVEEKNPSGDGSSSSSSSSAGSLMIPRLKKIMGFSGK